MVVPPLKTSEKVSARKQAGWVVVVATLVLGTFASLPIAQATPGIGNAVAVATGWGHTCILKVNENVDCHGDNYYGQAADYFSGDAVSISTGSEHTCILKYDNNVHCYGKNLSGQAAAYNGGDATGVAAGGFHTCVVTFAWNVDCYGSNSYGQSADYSGGDALEVGTGIQHTCLLKEAGNVDCYGRNDDGQAADYNGGDASTVALGHYHTCILKGSSGNVDCYGRNTYGQAADYFGGDATDVAAGGLHTCVLKSNGNVDCYGYNGDGRSNDYTGGDATAVSAGSSRTCVLTSNSNVRCYGSTNTDNSLDYAVPSSPLSFQASAGPSGGQITLSWETPADNGGRAVTSYKVYRGTTSGSATLVTSGGCSGLGNVLTCTDSGFGNGATRYYKISAVNTVGESFLTSESQATTFSTPGAPRNLQALPGPNAGETTLTWETPTNDGGAAITNYRVYRRPTTSSSYGVAGDAGTYLAYRDVGRPIGESPTTTSAP